MDPTGHRVALVLGCVSIFCVIFGGMAVNPDRVEGHENAGIDASFRDIKIRQKRQTPEGRRCAFIGAFLAFCHGTGSRSDDIVFPEGEGDPEPNPGPSLGPQTPRLLPSTYNPLFTTVLPTRASGIPAVRSTTLPPTFPRFLSTTRPWWWFPRGASSQRPYPRITTAPSATPRHTLPNTVQYPKVTTEPIFVRGPSTLPPFLFTTGSITKASVRKTTNWDEATGARGAGGAGGAVGDISDKAVALISAVVVIGVSMSLMIIFVICYIHYRAKKRIHKKQDIKKPPLPEKDGYPLKIADSDFDPALIIDVKLPPVTSLAVHNQAYGSIGSIHFKKMSLSSKEGDTSSVTDRETDVSPAMEGNKLSVIV